jgi:acetyl esterase/lipase
VLYVPPRPLPALANHIPSFRAPFNPVSGTENYVGGEYEYTDFLYDDDATTYPSDFARYGGNCGDLVELRVAVVPGGLAYRFTLNTLLQRDSTIAVLAFDRDRSATTGSGTLPIDPGVRFPGTDDVLTTWGAGAQWSHWQSGRWQRSVLKVTTDLVANQITVLVPDAVARPVGDWQATLATGLYDPATHGWLPVSATHNTNIVNLGFRFGEGKITPTGFPEGGPSTPSGGQPTDAEQNAALSAGEPTQLAHVIHFDWLRHRRSWDNIPSRGLMYRIYASHLAQATDDTGSAPSGNTIVDGLGTPPTTPKAQYRSEGKDNSSLISTYLSPLQPYALYVPSTYRRGHPMKLTFALHGSGGFYYQMLNRTYIAHALGEARDSIVLAPGGRGPGNFYVQDGEQDVFDAWNDVARHYTLDPTRTAMFGQSMGGYGTYRIASLYPQLFARAAPVVPAGTKGIYIPGFTDGASSINHWLPNLRNVPVFHIADMASELTFYPGQAQNAIGPNANGMNSLEALKYRYVFRSVAIDHVFMGTNFPELTSWLGNHQVESRPFHVTYVRMPASDDPHQGLVHDRAYWLSHIQIRNASAPNATGEVDAVSLGFGLSDPTTSLAPSAAPGLDAAGRPFVQLERDWAAPGRVPVQDRLIINATNIKSVTIDAVSARVTCQATIEVHSDGPLKVTLLGCPG